MSMASSGTWRLCELTRRTAMVGAAYDTTRTRRTAGTTVKDFYGLITKTLSATKGHGLLVEVASNEMDNP
jgi:hypothetical protein